MYLSCNLDEATPPNNNPPLSLSYCNPSSLRLLHPLSPLFHPVSFISFFSSFLLFFSFLLLFPFSLFLSSLSSPSSFYFFLFLSFLVPLFPFFSFSFFFSFPFPSPFSRFSRRQRYFTDIIPSGRGMSHPPPPFGDALAYRYPFLSWVWSEICWCIPCQRILLPYEGSNPRYFTFQVASA